MTPQDFIDLGGYPISGGYAFRRKSDAEAAIALATGYRLAELWDGDYAAILH